MKKNITSRKLTIAAAAVAAAAILAVPVATPAQATPAQATGHAQAAPAKQTAACKKATRTLAKARTRYQQARHQPSASGLKSAWNALRKAKSAKAKACAAKRPAQMTIEEKYLWSLPAYDPQRPDWVRPADGSGLPGSNYVPTTVIGGCPVTVSDTWIVQRESYYADGSQAAPVYSVITAVTNPQPTNQWLRVSVEFVDQNGNRVAANTYWTDYNGTRWPYDDPNAPLFNMVAQAVNWSYGGRNNEGGNRGIWVQDVVGVNGSNWNTVRPVSAKVECLKEKPADAGGFGRT